MKLIWSFDPFGDPFEKPFEKNDGLNRQAASAIEILTADGSWTIQPTVLVSQFSFFPIQAPCPSPRSDLAVRVSDAATSRLSSLAITNHLKALQPVHVILRGYHPLRAEVRELLDYAREENADLILTATRARTGWRRLLGGSFAESLVYHSDIPILFLNPGCEMHVQFKRLLFPTEIGSDFEEILPKIIQLAKILKSELTLFIQPSDQELAAARVESWTASAKKENVPLLLHSQPSNRDFISSVLKYAKKNADLIAYCERSRRDDSWSLAQETRKIIQGSPCPVLVFYPESKRRKSELSESNAA